MLAVEAAMMKVMKFMIAIVLISAALLLKQRLDDVRVRKDKPNECVEIGKVRDMIFTMDAQVASCKTHR